MLFLALIVGTIAVGGGLVMVRNSVKSGETKKKG